MTRVRKLLTARYTWPEPVVPGGANFGHPEDVVGVLGGGVTRPLVPAPGVTVVWLGNAVQPSDDGFPIMHRSGVPYGRLYKTKCLEQISIAYTQAVVTAARCKLEEIRVDDEKVDAVIRQEIEHPRYDGVSLDVQLKCTAQDVLKEDHVAWPLPKAHYDKLRSPKRYNPRILIIMLVPTDFETWITQDETGLRVVKCAYWMDLLGQPDINSQSTTVKVPRANWFDVEQLLGILSRMAAGGNP